MQNTNEQITENERDLVSFYLKNIEEFHMGLAHPDKLTIYVLILDFDTIAYCLLD